MKHLLLFSITILVMSCSLLKPVGTADYDGDGTVTDEEYDRFNTELDEKALQIAEDSVREDEGFSWGKLNPF